MSLSAHRFKRLSVAEYLAAENDGSWRHEFVNGAVFEFVNGVVLAMRASSFWHNFIRTNLAEVLHGHVAPGEKFDAYRRMPSLQEYGLLTQDAVELELFRRRTDWQREFFQQDNTVTFESVGLTINVSQLYRDIDFDGPMPPSGT